MNQKVIKEIISWFLVFGIALALAFLINRFIIIKVSSPTGSMENTIMIDDKVVTFRLSYLFHGPKRQDIVVFKYPDDETQIFIKRVIGLPGETIEGKDGVVYINGTPLDENYCNGKPRGDFGPYTIPEGSYFMMGDNRNISHDARYWDNKFVYKEKILGRAIFKYPKFTWFR
jgi:signal peptidase I